MTVEQVAKARMGRLATSKKTNPEHSLSKLADGFSWGEMASFFEIMADGTTGTVEKKFIEYWLSMLLCIFYYAEANEVSLLQRTSVCRRRLDGSDELQSCEEVSVLSSLGRSCRLLVLPVVTSRVMPTVVKLFCRMACSGT